MYAENMKNQSDENSIPLVKIEGTPFECGENYTQFVLENYPGFTEYLQYAVNDLNEIFENKRILKVYEKDAPFIIDILQGINKSFKSQIDISKTNSPSVENCTSFSVSGENCIDGQPLAGQNKDNPYNRQDLYIVLNMKIKLGPSMLALAYPGELLGYGLWDNGNSIFRNSLYSSEESKKGLEMRIWGFLAMNGNDISRAIQIASDFGIRGSGNILLNDLTGNSVSIEFNAGGIDFLCPSEGIITHANHPTGEKTQHFEDYPDKREHDNSKYREKKLYELLKTNSGMLTPENIFDECLSDHSAYPRGICRHVIGDKSDQGTTAAIVAEPAKRILHVTKGNPCLNKPQEYII